MSSDTQLDDVTDDKKKNKNKEKTRECRLASVQSLSVGVTPGGI